MRTVRDFVQTDRYCFDFGGCNYRDGWAQVDTDQDAWYYGQWANPFKLEFFSYTEGDTVRIICENEKEFVDYVRSVYKWSIDHGVVWHGIDWFTEDIKKEFEKMGLSDLFHKKGE